MAVFPILVLLSLFLGGGGFALLPWHRFLLEFLHDYRDRFQYLEALEYFGAWAEKFIFEDPN
jgi:hypothetical protein